MAISRRLLVSGALPALLILAGTASAAPWSAPAPVPGAFASKQLVAPVIRTNASGLTVAAWTVGTITYASARAPGGAWNPPRRIASATTTYTTPTITVSGRTIALGLVNGRIAHGSVRLARWTGRNTSPVIDGPSGVVDAAFGVWPSIVPNGGVIVVFGKVGGGLDWTTRRASGGGRPGRTSCRAFSASPSAREAAASSSPRPAMSV